MGEWLWHHGLGLLLFGTGGALLLGWSVSILRQARATRHWPQAPGEIVMVRRVTQWVSGENGRDAIQRVRLTYRYEVAGRHFQGRRVRVGPPAMAAVGATLRRYRKGQACLVAYDPQRPDVAVLEPGVHALHWLLPAVGLLLLGLALLGLVAKSAVSP
jgi:hypothetical protein